MTDFDLCRQRFEEECAIMGLPVKRTLTYENATTQLCWILWQRAWDIAKLEAGHESC
jgi:hypothetical protein